MGFIWLIIHNYINLRTFYSLITMKSEDMITKLEYVVMIHLYLEILIFFL
jgi:hypothetical protein